jgi:hypothetical protein
MYLLNIYGLKYFNNESTIFLLLIASIILLMDSTFNLVYFYNIFLSKSKDLSLASNGD